MYNYREKNLKFNEALQRLESDPKCQSLSLHSFLMLPMQRITRLPLLVDAILSQMNSTENSFEYQMCELTLASLNTVSIMHLFNLNIYFQTFNNLFFLDCTKLQ